MLAGVGTGVRGPGAGDEMGSEVGWGRRPGERGGAGMGTGVADLEPGTG